MSNSSQKIQKVHFKEAAKLKGAERRRYIEERKNYHRSGYATGFAV